MHRQALGPAGHLDRSANAPRQAISLHSRAAGCHCSHFSIRSSDACTSIHTASLAAAPAWPWHGPVGRARRGAVRVSAVLAASAPSTTASSSTAQDAAKYRFRTEHGTVIQVATQRQDKDIVATVLMAAEQLPAGATPALSWGLYRSSANTWYHPETVIPPGSALHGGAMRTPLSRDGSGGAWRVDFKVPSRMAPLQLAFKLGYADTGRVEGAVGSGAHMTVPIGMGAGAPAPLGPSLTSVTHAKGGSAKDATCTINFAVFSRNAAAMSLCIMRRDGGSYVEVALDPHTNRTGDVWHCALGGLKNVGQLCYGWRAGGAISWAEGGRFHPAYIMLDPYCPRALRMQVPQAAYDAAPMLPPEGELLRPVVMGSLSHLTEDFDWGDSRRPRRALEDTVLYELSVPAFTSGPEAARLVPPEHAGSYLGVIDRLPEISATGATAIALGSVMFGSETGRGAFGRSPLSFMAPETAFVAGGGEDPAEAAGQLKALVKAAHEAQLEVLLEVEFCLTAESVTDSSKLQSLKGLDGDIYFRGGGGPEGGSVLNAGQSAVRALIATSLRRWAQEFQVDGFVFINAENLAQDVFGRVLDTPPLAEELACDPLLRGIKIIAAPSDETLLPRGGVRGFPHHGMWLEWGRRFGELVPLVRDNAGGLLQTLAARMAGSPDITAAATGMGLPAGLAAGRRPAMAVNSLALPAGPGLLQLCGREGLDHEAAFVVARTLLLMLLVAEGTPAFNASPVANADLQRFITTCLSIRNKYKALLAPAVPTPTRTVTWHGTSPTNPPDWAGEGAGFYTPGWNFAAFSVVVTPERASGAPAAGFSQQGSSGAQAQAVYVAFNPHQEATGVQLPQAPPGMQWIRLVDTSRPPPADAVLEGGEELHDHYTLNPQAALMLHALPAKPAAHARQQHGDTAAADRAAAMYGRV